MRKKTMALVSSCAAIAVCSSLIVGSTYALFTSNSKVDISVKSGKVDVAATVDEDSLKTYSMGEEQEKGKFELGGTAGFNEDGQFVIGNIVSGDRATFNVNVTNNSTVNVKYRLGWSVSGALGEALEISGNDNAVWTEWTVPASESEKVKTLPVTVELPAEYDDVYGSEGSVQGEEATISLTVEAVQGNATVYDFEVSDESGLNEAIKNGGSIAITSDITVNSVFNISKDVTLDLKGNTITNNHAGTRPFYINTPNVTLTINGSEEGSKMVIPEGTNSYGFVDLQAENVTVVVNNVSFIGNTDDGGVLKPRKKGWNITLNNVSVETNYQVVGCTADGRLEANGGTYNLSGNSQKRPAFYLQAAQNASSGYSGETALVAVFNNVTITTTAGQLPIEVVGTNATLNNCTITNNSEKSFSYYGSSVCASYGGKVVVNGGTYTGLYGACVFSSGGSITLNGGTFTGTELDVKADDGTLTINEGTVLTNETKGSENIVDNR